MIRKYHNHKLQTSPRLREEEQQNTNCHKTSERQFKQSKQLSLPRQMIAKLEGTQSNAKQNKYQHRAPTNNVRYINNESLQENRRLRTDSSISHRGGGGGGGGGGGA